MAVIFIFAIGLALVAYGFYALMKYSPAKWREVDAIVTSSSAKAHAAQYSLVYTPQVAYRFVVDGKTYNGETYAFANEEDASAGSYQ